VSLAPNWSLLIPAHWRGTITRETVQADLIAGLTNASIVLPQAVAFATIAGLPPIYGLYTAMITPIVAALWGSSMVMVSGPTTAISAVVFSTLAGLSVPGSVEFIQLALLLTLMVGVIQFLLGFAGLGRLVAFVSHSVMLGFTAAAAVLIGVSQLAPAMGVAVERGGSVIERIIRTVEAADNVNLLAVAVAATAFLVTMLARWIAPRSPTFLIGLVAASGLAWYMDAARQGVAMVGDLPSIIPVFAPPTMSAHSFGLVTEGAFAIALIGLLEAVSIGRAFAYRTNTRFDANREIVGQGLSNIVGSLFQAYPGSGSFTRSGINYESGAKTPMSAIFAAIFLFFILLMFAPLVAHIPIPGLAGLILLVAYKLISFKEIWEIARTSGTELTIIFATFLAGVMVELDFAIYVGVILSLMIFLSKTSRPNLVISAPDENGIFRDPNLYTLRECPQAVFIRIDGPLYFGSVESIERGFRKIERARPLQQHLVLVLKGVGDCDLAGAHALIDEAKRRKKRGGALYIVTRYEPMIQRLRRLHVFQEIGEDHLLASKGDAIDTLMSELDRDICATCTARIFRECAGMPNAQVQKVDAAE